MGKISAFEVFSNMNHFYLPIFTPYTSFFLLNESFGHLPRSIKSLSTEGMDEIDKKSMQESLHSLGTCVLGPICHISIPTDPFSMKQKRAPAPQSSNSNGICIIFVGQELSELWPADVLRPFDLPFLCICGSANYYENSCNKSQIVICAILKEKRVNMLIMDLGYRL